MKKIIVATTLFLIIALGTFTALKAQGEWEWIDTGFDYILYDISFPEGQSEIGFAVGSTVTYNGDGIILRTTDSGYTWEQISEGTIPGLEAVCFTDLNTGYAGGWDNYFIKTTDGGETWSEISINPNIWYFNDIEFWDDNNGIASAWGGELYITDDAGESWTAATGVNVGVQDLTYASSSVLYAAGGDEKIIKSIDGGLSWTEIYSGVFQYVFVGVEFMDENYGVVGGEDGKVLITEDGGLTWNINPTSQFHLWHGIHIFNQDSIYIAGTPEGVYKTTDGGTTWVDDYPQSQYNVAFYKIIFTPDNFTGFICGSQGIIMRKEGIQLAPAANVTPMEIVYPQTWIGETVEFPLTVTNIGNAPLLVTDITSDNTAFYPDITNFELAPGEFQEVLVFFEPDDEGLFEGVLTIACNDPQNPLFEVSLQGEGLLQQAVISVPSEMVFDTTTINNVATETLVVWNIGNSTLEVTAINSSDPVFEVNISTFSIEPGESQDILVSFTPVVQGMVEETLEMISNDAGSPTIIAVSGYGVLGTGMAETSTQKKLLYANPNPFDNKVVIRYQSTLKKFETLKIYNLFGGLVTELEQGTSNVDNFEFIWDGRSQSGENIPSGIYFGVLSSGGAEQSIKIIKN